MLIKSFVPRPFNGWAILPTYASDLRTHTLLGMISGGYEIMLAKLTVGESISAGNPLTHAMFESFTDHGERRALTRTRVSGYEREYTAVKNAMIGCGVEFLPAPPCGSEEMLNALGDWFRRQNPEIESCSLVSQS